jgi:hypothetical protein
MGIYSFLLLKVEQLDFYYLDSSINTQSKSLL